MTLDDMTGWGGTVLRDWIVAHYALFCVLLGILTGVGIKLAHYLRSRR